MTISKRRLELTDVDLDIALAIGLGLTIEKTAEFAGCSTTTVSNRKSIETVASLIDKVKTLHRKSKDEFEQVTKENYRKKLEKHLAKADRNLDGFLDSEDPGLAMDATKFVINQNIGSAAQTQKIEKEVTERHIVEIPAIVMDALRGITIRKQLPDPNEIDGETDDDPDSASGSRSSQG